MEEIKLKNILDETQQIKIPRIKRKPCMFDAAGFPNRETANSNVWAYYLREENHPFGRLFMNALFEIIDHHKEEINDKNGYIPSWDEHTDYTILVEKDKIDIQVLGPHLGGNDYSWAIIIENKINHHIKGNPLRTYWKKARAVGGKKLGIILAPGIVKAPNEYNDLPYISITHQDLMEQVIANQSDIDENTLNENEKHQLMMFKDFQNHIFNITNMSQYNKEVRDLSGIYFQHSLQIESLRELREKMWIEMDEMLLNLFNKNGFGKHTLNALTDRRDLTFGASENRFPDKFYPENLRFWLNKSLLFKKGEIQCSLYFHSGKKDDFNTYRDRVDKIINEIENKGFKTYSLFATNGQAEKTEKNANHDIAHLQLKREEIEAVEINDSEGVDNFLDRVEYVFRKSFFEALNGKSESLVQKIIHTIEHKELYNKNNPIDWMSGK